MIQSTLKEITIDSLVVLNPESLDEKLARMNPTESDDRRVAIEAIKSLIDLFVKSAMKKCPPSRTRFGLFDLNAVAKTEIHGLVLGLFEQRINELNPTGRTAPNDTKLKELFDYLEISSLNADERANFYTCWAGDAAFLSIYSLVNFLEKPLIKQVTPNIEGLMDERIQIRKLLETKLPDKLNYILTSLLEQLEQVQTIAR